MSVQELVLETGSGQLNFISFVGSSLFIKHGSASSDPRKHTFLFSSYDKSSQTEIPLCHVIAATLSDRTVQIHYLIRRGRRQQLSLQQLCGTVKDSDTFQAQEWCSSITQLAYKGGSPPKSLRVLINPCGGPGRARQIFTNKVEPILRAAGCTLDVTYTTRAGHAVELVQHMDLTYDALVVVSGDGLIHEVMNGLAKHATPEKAFCIPVAPIPAGSGNALSLNILGLGDGLDPCAAALNVLKGRAMKVDLFSFTQGNLKRISFFSQSIGFMADLDIETEHLRWMGDIRFVLGFLRGIVTRKTCEMELTVKIAEQDKAKMVDALYARRMSAAEVLSPALVASDFAPSNEKLPIEPDFSGDEWVKFDKPILFMFAGKGPYVNRSLMQFPVSHPDDGLIDISIQEIVDRKTMLDAMEGAEAGRSYWFNSNRYFKASAYRAKPLKSGGILVIDGEAFPFEEFEIEVLQRLGTVLSPHPYYAADFKVIDAKGTVREKV